jgi:UDP-2-acetamido-2-deoxy-ribo-hexuluronate aminotransferase
MQVPFFNFERRVAANVEAIKAAIESTVESGQFILKDGVTKLENAISEYTGASHCIAMSSATSCMTIALQAAGVTEGDEVITPAFS